MPSELYPFRYRDPLTGKWVKARYLAKRHEIAARYTEWEIIGAPEVREGGQSRYFHPFLPPKAPLPDVDRSPILDDTERFLALAFLRRYVRYCARRRWFARMEGAAKLARTIHASGANLK